ncbi:uncharacterized protein PG986_010545 [Apiospora aurea]|uniref:DUF7791 domain-containing protein n=1 Tax=Apiospora aurea TaxID=335848 RepID=A0ABR1Q382_9PEZI
MCVHLFIRPFLSVRTKHLNSGFEDERSSADPSHSINSFANSDTLLRDQRSDMAELAAIGLASNVLQFVGAGIKLFTNARRIHKSAKGTTQKVEDLGASLSNLERIADSLQIGAQRYSALRQSTGDERNLMATATECSSYARGFLGQLEKTKVTSSTGLRRRWESFRVALALSGDELESHQKKLESFQTRLLLELGASMINKQSAIVRTITSLRDANDDLRADTMKRLDALVHETTTMLQAQNRNISVDITIYTRQTLPVAAYEFLDQERADPNFALSIGDGNNPPAKTHKSTIQRMKKRLNARCKDLLEITYHQSDTSPFTYQVDFLHRTVRDFFLGTNAMSLVMKERHAAEFDPLVTLSRIMLALAKLLIGLDGFSEPRLMDLVDSMLCYIHQIESGVVGAPSSAGVESTEARVYITHELLDNLDVAIAGKLGENWASTLQSHRSRHFKRHSYLPVSLLELTMESHVSSYAIQKFRENPQILTKILERPWLDWALRHKLPKTRAHQSESKIHAFNACHANLNTLTYTPEPDADVLNAPNKPVVLYLLDHAADPNERVAARPGAAPGTTVWAAFLTTYYELACEDPRAFSWAARDDLCKVMVAMIDKCADPLVETEGGVGVAAVARKLFTDRRQIEAIEAALWRRQAETTPYLASFTSWFRSG